MITFRSEFLNNYDTYTFSFSEYAILETDADITDIYSNGYLPYTGNISLKYPVFYLARSLRVDTEKFKDTSENRRVDRKSGISDLTITKIPLHQFDINNKDFINFCLDYANERFSGNAMSGHRFTYILNSGIATDIFEFRNGENNNLLGYVLAVLDENTFHYWFSFYNSDYLDNFPIGKWMMWKMIKWSKENDINHIYLGTAYGKKALYKIRDFKGLEFFNGNIWDNDLKKLKHLCKNDNYRKEKDLFKLSDNPNQYIETILKK